MRVVFIDHYSGASSLHKEPITIPAALAARGHDVSLASVNEWQGSLAGLRTERLSHWQADLSGPRRADAVVAITRFDSSLTPTLRVLKRHDIRVIVKGDTDGTLGFPVTPNYLRARPLGANPINVLRHLKWRLPLRAILRPRLEQIMLADLVVAESPGAIVNLAEVLQHWGHVGSIPKLRFIPNPVSPAVTTRPLKTDKTRTIVSAGRWDDNVKGGDLLRATIERAVDSGSQYTFLIIGNGGKEIYGKLRSDCRCFVECPGSLDFDATQEAISKSRILLVTSLLESFSFVAAEALSSGTSLVVTPIESLVYLAGGGAYGSIARKFSVAAITAALLNEIREWDQGNRTPSSISSYWRPKLNIEVVSELWDKALR